jgi:hypothetical protein
LRRQELQLAVLSQPAQLVQPLDAGGDRSPVREQAPEPAVIHVRHADARRLLLDGVLCLLLRADEQNRAAPLREVARERRSLLEQGKCLLEIDDVDPTALVEDEALHLRVPAAGLVAEMDPGLEEFSHGNDGQWSPFVVRLQYSRRPAGGPTCKRRHPHPSSPPGR